MPSTPSVLPMKKKLSVITWFIDNGGVFYAGICKRKKTKPSNPERKRGRERRRGGGGGGGWVVSEDGDAAIVW